MTVPTRPVVTLEARGAPHAADANQVRGVFTTATGRQFTQSLDQPGSGSFTIQYYLPSGQPSPDLALLDATNTDVLVWVATDIGSQCVFRGRLTDAQVSAQAPGKPTVACQLRDYKSLLRDRVLLDADCTKMVITGQSTGPLQRNYAVGVDLGSIVWDLIRIMQARSFGTYGITSSGDGIPTTPTTMTTTAAIIPTTGNSDNNVRTGGNGTTGIHLAKVWEMAAGITNLYDEINALGAGNQSTYDFGSGPVGTAGFDWSIEPNPGTGLNQIHLYPKLTADGRGRGTDAQWVLDYGGSAAGFTTDWSVDLLGTFVRLSMDTWSGDRQIDASSAALGRWERMVTLTSPYAPNFRVPNATTYQPIIEKIDKAAAQAFMNDTTVRYGYTVTLAPAIDPTEQLTMGIGDTARIQVPTLTGPSNTLERIVGRTLTVSDNGDLAITLALAKLPIFSTGARARSQQKLSDDFHRLLSSIRGGSYAP